MIIIVDDKILSIKCCYTYSTWKLLAWTVLTGVIPMLVFTVWGCHENKSIRLPEDDAVASKHAGLID